MNCCHRREGFGNVRPRRVIRRRSEAFGDCGIGEIISSDGGCQLCPEGTYANHYINECTTCPEGTYSGSGSEKENCMSCPAGWACPSGVKTLCHAGTYSSAKATTCTSCAAGTYQDQEGKSSCTSCAAGTYSDAGASKCTDCKAGTYSSAEATTCTSCAAGTYQDQEGKSSCISCPVGQYSEIQGASECLSCPSGQTTDNDRSTSSASCGNLCEGTSQNNGDELNFSEFCAGAPCDDNPDCLGTCFKATYVEANRPQWTINSTKCTTKSACPWKSKTEGSTTGGTVYQEVNQWWCDTNKH